jgi:hypothetical protein
LLPQLARDKMLNIIGKSSSKRSKLPLHPANTG